VNGRHVVVVGGSVAGLGAALALTADGHRVTILEGDPSPMPGSHVAAFERWERRGSPQVHHSHALLARLRNLIRDHAPELLGKLLACGAEELRFTEMAKRLVPGAAVEPGDEDVVLLACRRVTFEWVLRRHVLDGGLVDFRDGVTVTGLLADPGDPPRVTGVRLRAGEGPEQALAADLVVDASGRRSKLRHWLEAIGTPPVREESEPCGIFYTSRFYRLREGVEPPPLDGPIVGEDLGYLKVGLFPGDARIFSVTLAASPDDDAMRAVLHRPAFEAAAGALPRVASWVDPAVSEPISEVHAMADLRNTRRFLVEGGRPLALGVLAIGDALIHTNPITGRGCALAWVSAFELARALREHAADPRALALAHAAAVEREVVPWYRMQLQQDRDASEVSQAQRRGEDAFRVVRPDGTNDPKAFMRSVLREGLLPAIRSDLVVMRRFMRLMNLLDPPDDLMRDPTFFGRIVACYHTRHQREPLAAGPPREELLGAIARAA
jgi:2-polyprenyl-6-methoxyphenol hydroxylase-like FAD-dependent oxidoreductase